MGVRQKIERVPPTRNRLASHARLFPIAVVRMMMRWITGARTPPRNGSRTSSIPAWTISQNLLVTLATNAGGPVTSATYTLKETRLPVDDVPVYDTNVLQSRTAKLP